LMKLQKGRTSRPSARLPATRPIKANTGAVWAGRQPVSIHHI
jgi:hypothetical protein